ncbi:MAG: DUF423 domain-containing protein [Inquilinaceae bacterium]
MTRVSRACLIVASIHGAGAVGLGAFAAHAMGDAGGPAVGWVETGARFQLIHAASLVGLAALAGGAGLRRFWLRAAMIGFGLGPALFAGALYATAMAGPGWWTAAAPAGGVLMIAGWLALLPAALAGPGDAGGR